jgi:hypothetical protein
MFTHAEDLYKYERIEDVDLTDKELKGFAYMVVNGALAWNVSDYISNDRLQQFERLGLVYKDRSITVTDYYFISQRYLSQIVFLYFETFYRLPNGNKKSKISRGLSPQIYK